MFVVFSNKTSRWFKYVCIKMWTCKISARFHSLTEMSPDRNVPDRNVPRPKQPRPKRPRPKRLRPNRPYRIGQTEKSCTHLLHMQGRNEVKWCLARSKFGACMFECELFHKQIYCIAESTDDLVRFSAPPTVIRRPYSDLVRGKLCTPWPPLLRPCTCALFCLCIPLSNAVIKWIFSRGGPRWGNRPPKTCESNLFTMILNNLENSIGDIRLFCRYLFCHSSFVKYTASLLQYSEAVMRLNYQI